MPLSRIVRVAMACLLGGVSISGQQPTRSADVEVVGHIVKPAAIEPTTERLAGLKLPPGFHLDKFATGLGDPRILAVSDAGRVYVTRRAKGDCLMLEDTNGDGIADKERVVVARPGLHGIAIHEKTVYLATIHDIYTATLTDDGSFTEPVRIVKDLPDAGQHADRTLAIGPDGQLYVSVGSTCNVCLEDNPENATMLRVQPDGKSRTIFASGLRNTIGFDWHPVTHELYGMDHGVDWLGDNAQEEELNRIEQGHRYGWPFVFAAGQLNVQHDPPGGVTPEQWAKMSDEPASLYVPHAAPMQMVFYTGTQFPQEYRNDAFVAMHGSWNRRPPSGYEIVRVRFTNNKPTSIEPFITGFLVNGSNGAFEFLARPVGLAVAKDGALLMSDDANGVIYRISYKQERRT